MLDWSRYPCSESWEGFPEEVATLYKAAAEIRDTLKLYSRMMPAQPGYGYIYWHPKEQKAWAVVGPESTEQDMQKWHIGLQALRLKGGFHADKERHPSDPSEWVRIKAADRLAIIDEKFASFEARTPMANSLVGGLLGAGAGYGAGMLAEKMLPTSLFDPRAMNLRRAGAVFGGAIGVSPGLLQQFGHSGTAAQAGKDVGWTTTTDDMPNAATDPKLKAQLDLRNSTFAPHPALAKVAAQFNRTGVADISSVPKDAFNRAIWNDVSMGLQAARNNPYGTKSVWGDDSQAMHTPPAVGAAMSGLVSGLAEKYDTKLVSPSQIVSGLVGAGIGGATARVIGSTLGTLAGLRPEAQQQLQQVGIWGGLMQGMANSLFGR